MSSKLKKGIVQWVVVPFIGAILISLTMDSSNLIEGNYKRFFQDFAFSFLFWLVLGGGNSWIVELINRRWNWIEHPIKRTILGIIGMVIFTVPATLLILSVLVNAFYDISLATAIEKRGFFSLVIFPFLITVFVTLWAHGRNFLLQWRQASIDVERLKTESIKSRFESLRNQVNPHFLFNSLNALSSLVYVDQAKAVDFIQKLAQVYRYVLDHQNDEVVDLASEFQLLESFVYLNKIRFGENLQVVYHGFEVPDPKAVIPPVVLQLLVENCLKHNEVSKEKQLRITISKSADFIEVENNLNPMNTPSESTGMGLSNIRSRYEILSDKEVEVTQDHGLFKVRVPLLTMSA